MAGEGLYHKVLADHKRRLGDYEQVHFCRRPRSTVITSENAVRAPSMIGLGLNSSGSGSGTGITLAPRRTSRALPQLGEFSSNTASLHLRQSENMWLCPSLSRQEATKALFDRPVGTFIVRNSQKARYALTVRVPTDNPAVSHFLIQTNQQGFLTIQGSNLPFLSIYDLLAYFCFNKSGGMPCLLIKPQPRLEKEQPLEPDSSDSSDSEEEAKEPYRSRAYNLMSPTSPPPPVPPHQPSQSPLNSFRQNRTASVDMYPVHEEIFIDSHKQSDYLQGMKEKLKQKRSGSQSPVHSTTLSSPPSHHRKREPPPKPPRGSTLIDDDDDDPPEEAQQVIRSVGSIVDMDARNLYHSYRRITLTEREVDGRDGGSREGKGQGEKSESERSPQWRHSRLQRKMSWSSDNLEKMPRHVVSLVEMFEKNKQSYLLTGSSPNSGGFRLRLPAHPAPGDSAPILPPRPSRPFRPPRIFGRSLTSDDEPPAVPPHTPAPLIPRKPQGSRAPFIVARKRSLSENSYPGKSRPPAPPPGEDASPPLLPPKAHWSPKSPKGGSHYEFDTELRAKLASHRSKEAEGGGEVEREREGDGDQGRAGKDNWASASADPRLEGRVNGVIGNSNGQKTENDREQSTSGVNEGSGKDRSKWKRAWPKKLPKFYRKPRKKIRKFIVDLAGDSSVEFGQMVGEFISDIKAHSSDPYHNMLSEIRTFITKMHDHLLQHHHAELTNYGMEACNNFEHVVETSLQQCILRPLSLYVYLRIEEHLMEDGSLFQVQRSVHQGKNKTPQEMGIREGLVVPGEKVVSEIGSIFNRMTKTYCAISKLEYLLETVRLTYENVRDSKNPKKSMSDLGADDFLPLFVWVLVQCSFTRAEIEAEYMWGLAHPSLFNGEAGYYLTTLTSAVNVLKETQHSMPLFPQSSDSDIGEQVQLLPCMNDLETELKVYFEDATTGQYSSAYRLPIVPDMTAAAVCDIIAEKHCKSNPQKYGLYTVVDGQASEMGKEEHPQEVKTKWAQEKAAGKSPNIQRQPSSRFIAYRLRTPQHTK